MGQPKTAKPYHHGELREALVTAGRKLLEERGLRGFTLRECARRAGVSHAAPAHHFASIDDLLAEIAARGHHDLVAAMSAEARRSDGSPAARLVGLGVGYMAFAAANPVLFQLMFSREANRFETPGLAQASQAAYHLQREAVEAVIPQASGEVKDRMVDLPGPPSMASSPWSWRGSLARGIRRVLSRRVAWRRCRRWSRPSCGPAVNPSSRRCETAARRRHRRRGSCGSA
jgi:AcrR family transcriptional regulator